MQPNDIDPCAYLLHEDDYVKYDNYMYTCTHTYLENYCLLVTVFEKIGTSTYVHE